MNIEKINKRILLLIENQVISIENFYRNHNIDPDELSYLGSGDFGEAYITEDGRVVKITSSNSEFDIAKSLIGKAHLFTNFVEIYDAEITSIGMTILMEGVDQDSEIEDMFYTVTEILETQGLPIQYIGHFDEDEYDIEIPSEVADFMHQLENVNSDYRRLGIEASDIRPENMGYSEDGTLKAFDIDNKQR